MELPLAEVSDEEIKGALKPVMPPATPVDLALMEEYRTREIQALDKCREKIVELGLPMKVIRAEYGFNGRRLLFAFISEQRVDFRELVRVLARSFKTRIEMKQIGARDEAKLIGGYGRCGRELCCTSWLTEFHPVSIKMAKQQDLPLAPSEISGVCGRLLCCLAYENDLYTELKKALPKVGSEVNTSHGSGIVVGLNEIVLDEGLAQPIVVGRPAVLAHRIEKLGLRMQPGTVFQVVNPEHDPRYRTYWTEYYALTSRRGVSQQYAKIEMRRRLTLIGAMMIYKGEADGMLCGMFGTHALHLQYIDQVIGLRPGVEHYAAMNALMLPNQTVFICDTYVTPDPDPENIAEMTMLAAEEVRRCIVPKVALLSASNFGSVDIASSRKMQRALALLSGRAARPPRGSSPC